MISRVRVRQSKLAWIQPVTVFLSRIQLEYTRASYLGEWLHSLLSSRGSFFLYDETITYCYILRGTHITYSSFPNLTYCLPFGSHFPFHFLLFRVQLNSNLQMRVAASKTCAAAVAQLCTLHLLVRRDQEISWHERSHQSVCLYYTRDSEIRSGFYTCSGSKSSGTPTHGLLHLYMYHFTYPIVVLREIPEPSCAGSFIELN